MQLFRAVINAVAAVTILGGVCACGAVNGLLGGHRRVAARMKRWAGRSILASCGVRPIIEGLEHVPPGGGFVLISNHESHFDGPFLVGWFPRDFTIVAKRELFRIPIVGQGFRGFGFIEVDRANHAQSVASLDAATAYLQGGGGVLVFPEGHRTETGELQEFKKGAFIQALKAHVPLIPVAIGGTRAVLPAGSLFIRSRPVALCIGPPIEVAGRTVEDRDELLAECREMIVRLRTRAHVLLRAETSLAPT